MPVSPIHGPMEPPAYQAGSHKIGFKERPSAVFGPQPSAEEAGSSSLPSAYRSELKQIAEEFLAKAQENLAAAQKRFSPGSEQVGVAQNAVGHLEGLLSQNDKNELNYSAIERFIIQEVEPEEASHSASQMARDVVVQGPVVRSPRVTSDIVGDRFYGHIDDLVSSCGDNLPSEVCEPEESLQSFLKNGQSIFETTSDHTFFVVKEKSGAKIGSAMDNWSSMDTTTKDEVMTHPENYLVQQFKPMDQQDGHLLNLQTLVAMGGEKSKIMTLSDKEAPPLQRETFSQPVVAPYVKPEAKNIYGIRDVDKQRLHSFLKRVKPFKQQVTRKEDINADNPRDFVKENPDDL